jgi:DNA-binding response OmpR family regulator
MPPSPTILDDLVEEMIHHRLPLDILLAEDDSAMRALVAEPLREDGYGVLEARDGAELIRASYQFKAAKVPLHLIITDVRLPGFTGIEVLEYLRAAGVEVPVIVMTAFGDDATHAQARALDAVMVLDKPFDVDELRAAVARLLPRVAA